MIGFVDQATLRVTDTWVVPASTGVGTFSAKFHHLAELTGRLADNVLTAHKEAAE